MSDHEGPLASATITGTLTGPYVVMEIMRERERQIAKGYDAAEDDKLTDFQLVERALFLLDGLTQRRVELIEAAALLVAEIERMDRAAKP